ncbi:MAG: hypothetical protein H6839_03000 [Planctomycetes bacterium]|nr:hypothetical protein [Planctomycetota bacterium]
MNSRQNKHSLRSRWNGLALWLRWAIAGSPAAAAFLFQSQLGDNVVWLAVPGGVLIVLMIFMTWGEIGDVMRARAR